MMIALAVTIALAVASLALGIAIGWLACGWRKKEMIEAGHTKKYRLELSGRRYMETDDGAVAAEIVEQERAQRRGGRLYMGAKLINSW